MWCGQQRPPFLSATSICYVDVPLASLGVFFFFLCDSLYRTLRLSLSLIYTHMLKIASGVFTSSRSIVMASYKLIQYELCCGCQTNWRTFNLMGHWGQETKWMNKSSYRDKLLSRCLASRCTCLPIWFISIWFSFPTTFPDHRFICDLDCLLPPAHSVMLHSENSRRLLSRALAPNG
jgi:hypothetical protein